MISETKFQERFPGIIVFVLLVNLFFLSYLGLTSQLIIFHDSIGYQNLAEMFVKGQWKDYFMMGPGREPLYSLSIALSMRVGQWLNIDYLALQILFQILILMVTQLLTYTLLKKLRISDGICAITLAYMGFSPGFTSSGLILFSEIITYPVILWLLFSLGRAWTQLTTASSRQNITNALHFVLPSLLITFTKGAFELIIPILIIPFLWKSIQAFKDKKTKTATNALIFTLAALVLFELPIIAYKSANQHFNGIYALTDRGPEALYGNTKRRMQPLTSQRLETALTYAAGPDVCSRLYAERCLPWAFLASDVLGAETTHALLEKGLNKQRVNHILIQESLTTALKHPLQYALLSFLEGSKMLFWEAPEISYVVYTDMIDKIYNAPWFRYPLRFLTALFSGWAFVSGLFYIWANRKKFSNPNEEQFSYAFFLILVILAFSALHSIFFVLPRYALPIAPLFIALIAWQMDIIFKKQKRQ